MAAPGTQIPPPFQNLPFGQVRDGGVVFLSVPAIQFLQELWSAIQGPGGIIVSPVSITAGTGLELTPDPLVQAGTVGLADIPSGDILANVAAGDAAPAPTSLSAVLDLMGSAEGDVLYRGLTAWAALGAGAAGSVLQTAGPFAMPGWATILQLLDLIGATQGDILYRDAATWTTLAPGTAGYVLQTAGAAASPVWAGISALLDTIGLTQGDILFRAAAGWAVLAPGTGGYVLQTNGAAADPTWVAPTPGSPASTTFAGLPATPADGQRAFINNGSVVALGNFGTLAAGGGANHVPVYWDAALAGWYIG